MMHEKRDSPCWYVGSYRISAAETKSMLGQPRFFGNHPRSSVGGAEEQWKIYLSTSLTIILRHKTTYDILDVCVAGERIPDDLIQQMAEIIPGKTMDTVERPYDEMRNPKDPAFYYFAR